MAHILAQFATNPAAVLKALGGASKRELTAQGKRIKRLEEALDGALEILAGDQILEAAAADAEHAEATAAAGPGDPEVVPVELTEPPAEDEPPAEPEALL